jgi:hypothetical protein
VQRANAALEQAIANGRNRVEADEGMNTPHDQGGKNDKSDS